MYMYLASTYGSGNYDDNVYNGATTTGTGTGSSGSTSAGGSTSGSLSNTGFDVLLISSLACVIALAALAVRIWKRPGKLSAVAATAQDEQR